MMFGPRNSHPSFRRSFLIALQGMRMALSTERNIKIMMGFGAGALVAGVLLRIDALSWALVLLCCGTVISTELVNTAIETVVDLVSPEFHPLAGRAKDVAAAASWVISFTAAIVGLIVYVRAAILLFS